MQRSIATLAFLLFFTASAKAALITIDFDDQPINLTTPDIQYDQTIVSFTNLMTIETGSSTFGFGGGAGHNQVPEKFRTNFSGNFLTATNFSRAKYRTNGYVRTISFNQDVSDLDMYIADIDSGQRVTVNAYDSTDRLLDSIDYSIAANLESAWLEHVKFAGLNGIRAITVVGNDPIGIDNLSFSTDAIPAPVPLPAAVWLMLSGLVLLGLIGRRGLVLN